LLREKMETSRCCPRVSTSCQCMDKLHAFWQSHLHQQFCLGLDPYAGPYVRIAKLIQGIPIVTSILQPSTGASSSSSSLASPDQDLANDYPEIRGSTYWDSVEEGRFIIMVAPIRRPLHNSSSRYPTIGRSEASDAHTFNDGMIRNMNPDFNVVRL
jgi:hypothetical protein